LKILVLSDIHGNQEALAACLAAAPAYDLVFNLGDIVGYGASPNEVVEKSRSLGGIFVRGNHDKACSGISDAEDFNHIAALAAYWTRMKLTPENLEWVRALPQGPIKSDKAPETQCVHGSPLDEDEYIIIVRDAYQPLTTQSSKVTFFGHTHIQGGFSMNVRDEWTTIRPRYESENDAEHCTMQLLAETKYLINPGSVGQPRDGDWRAAFVVFDSEALTVTFYRTPYDLESAQNKIFAANLPDRLATRLREGR
jgi:predicted phosphodiesterase